MTQPIVVYFTPVAAGFDIQAYPAGHNGFFDICPAIDNIANDTHVTAYNGIAAVIANCIGTNYSLVGTNHHRKPTMAKPFINGLYVQAPNANVDWLIYIWPQLTQFEG